MRFYRADRVSVGGMRKLIPHFVRSFVSLVIISAAATIATPASAQVVDWLVNIDDAGFDPFPAGGEVEIDVTVTNNGFGNAPATTIDIDVPVGSSLAGTAGGISNCLPAAPQPGGTTITCDVPALGSTAVASLVLALDTPTDGVLITTATVADPSNVDSDPVNDSITETTTITNGAEIELTISSASLPAAASGSEVSFTFTAENQGPNTADGLSVQLSDPDRADQCDAPVGLFKCRRHLQVRPDQSCRERDPGLYLHSTDRCGEYLYDHSCRQCDGCLSRRSSSDQQHRSG